MSYLFQSGDVILNDDDEGALVLNPATSAVFGATTLSVGDVDAPYCRVAPEWQVSSAPVRADQIGECWRANDEVLSTTPFYWAFPEIVRTGSTPWPFPRIFMFFPDSARKLRFTFQMRVDVAGQVGVAEIRSQNGVPSELGGGVSDVVTVTTTSAVWEDKTVEIDVYTIARTLDMVEGILTGKNVTGTVAWPNHQSSLLSITDLLFTIYNQNGGTVRIRKTEDVTSRFIPAEVRGPDDTLVQGVYSNLFPDTNARTLQVPARGYTQIDLEEQGIVAGQPVYPTMLAALTQNDRSHAAFLDIGAWQFDAPDANWASSPYTDVYIPKWAGRIYCLAALYKLSDSGGDDPGLQRVVIRGELNDGVAYYGSDGAADPSVGKLITNEGGFTDPDYTQLHWTIGDAYVWIYFDEDVVEPLRGTDVQFRWQMRNTTGTRTKRLYVNGSDFQINTQSKMLPMNFIILPPQVE